MSPCLCPWAPPPQIASLWLISSADHGVQGQGPQPPLFLLVALRVASCQAPHGRCWFELSVACRERGHNPQPDPAVSAGRGRAGHREAGAGAGPPPPAPRSCPGSCPLSSPRVPLPCSWTDPPSRCGRLRSGSRPYPSSASPTPRTGSPCLSTAGTPCPGAVDSCGAQPGPSRGHGPAAWGLFPGSPILG